MPRGRAQHRGKGRRSGPALALPRDRQPREDREIPEIWEPYRGRIPATNPGVREHEPEFHYMIDVTGERVAVMESRIVKLKITSHVKIDEIKKINAVLPAENLWCGPWHHVLTNALRVLKVCAAARNSMDELPDFRRLRPGISAVELLERTGLPAEQAEEVIKNLKRLNLLAYRRSESSECWYVNLGFHGIGLSFEKYRMEDLVDNWAIPGGDDVPADDTGTYPPPGPSSDGGEDEPAEADTRLETLRSYYAFVMKLVGDSPEMVERDGEDYAVFTTPAPLTDLAAAELGLTKSQAGLAQASLSRLCIMKNEMVGQGRWMRYVRPDVQITPDHVEELRRDNRQKHADRVARTKRMPKDHLERLKAAYEIVLEEVPEGLEPDGHGYVEFEASHSFRRLFEERIEGLSSWQAEELHKDLRYLDLLITTPLGGAGKWRKIRRVKLGKKITQKDTEKVMETRRRMRRNSPANSSVEAPASGSTPDEIEQIFAAAAEKLDAYASEIEDLNGQLKQRDQQIAQLNARITQLEGELKAGPPAKTYAGLDRLRAHLHKDSK